MTLPDYPKLFTFVGWNVGISNEVLQELGRLAVTSAHVEHLLHQIYWIHAGLDGASGPIVTGDLKPKRLAEDILNLVKLSPAKAHILDDLTILVREFDDLNEQRNQCIHWLWSSPEYEFAISPDHTYKVAKPAYRRKGKPEVEFDLTKLTQLCNDCAWLERRLSAHAMPETSLRAARENTNLYGSMIAKTGTAQERQIPLADLVLPAPWLDKQAPPDAKPSEDRASPA